MKILPQIRVLFDRHKTASLLEKGTVEIEVYFRNERRRVTLPMALLKSQWKSGMVVNHPQADAYNNFIHDICTELSIKIAEMGRDGIFDLDVLSDVIKSKRIAVTMTFLEFMEERIKVHAMRDSTRKQHMIVLNWLKEYGKLVCFSDFTRPNIKLFDDWLHARGICQTTIHSYHKRLKVYVHEAMEFKYIRDDPYVGLRIPNGTSSKVKYLLEDERKRIEELQLKGVDDLVRDIFVFGTYTGLAFSDIMKIKKEDFYKENGRLYLVDCRLKTSIPYKLTMLGPAQSILEKYDYHFPDISNQAANHHLKQIGKMAGIREELTTHMARHTFATWALKKRLPIEIVSKMLAHTNIKQTQVYAQVLQASVDDGFDRLESTLLNYTKAY